MQGGECLELRIIPDNFAKRAAQIEGLELPTSDGIVPRTMGTTPLNISIRIIPFLQIAPQGKMVYSSTGLT